MPDAKSHNLYEFEEAYKSKLPVKMIRQIWERNANLRDNTIGTAEFAGGAGLSILAGNLIADAALAGSVKNFVGALGCWIGAAALVNRGGNRAFHSNLFSKQFDEDGDLNRFARGSRWVARKSDKEAHLLVTLRELANLLVKPAEGAPKSFQRRLSVRFAAVDV